MDIKQLNEKLDRFILNEQQLNEMSCIPDDSDNIYDFEKHVKQDKENGVKKPREAVINGLRIISSIYDDHCEKHNLSLADWNNFLNNYNIENDTVKIGEIPRFCGEVHICKIYLDKWFCYIVETFKNKQPILTTLFYDNEKKMNHWIKQTK